MKKLIKFIVPKYAYIPLLLMMGMNFITYYGTTLITNSMYHYDASIFVDNYIPFCSIFILFYIIAYVQWVIGYIIIVRENKRVCYYYVFAELIAKSLCLFFFLIFPTTISRPLLGNDNIFLVMTNFIYQTDSPVNLFPSIHCLESWMCFRGSLSLKKVPKWYKYLMFITTILVCLSTVFIKQHVFIDVLGGIIAVEIGLFFSNQLKV